MSVSRARTNRESRPQSQRKQKLWEKRRREAIENEWRDAQLLRARAAEMLSFPLSTQTTDHEGKVTVIEPTKWTLSMAASFLKLAVEMETAALDEALVRFDDDFDPQTATTEELRKIAGRKGDRRA